MCTLCKLWFMSNAHFFNTTDCPNFLKTTLTDWQLKVVVFVLPCVFDTVH
jgi:hypothetical protein